MQVGITLWGDSGDHSVQRPILAIYIVWDAGRKKLNEVQCIPSCLPIRKPGERMLELRYTHRYSKLYPRLYSTRYFSIQASRFLFPDKLWSLTVFNCLPTALASC